MEFGHRSWGRLIGAAFFIPAAGLWISGRLSPLMKKRVAACGVLIAAQGLMGWYMVKSGLQDRFHGESDVPRVSEIIRACSSCHENAQKKNRNLE